MLKKFLATVLVAACLTAPLAADKSKPKPSPHSKELLGLYMASRDDGHEMQIPGDEHGALFLKLLRVAAAHDVKVVIAHIPVDTLGACPCWGVTLYKKKLIVIEKDERTVNEQVNALAHELAHALATDGMDHPDDDIFAEGVAFIVLAHFGFNTSFSSVSYYENVLAEDRFTIINGIARLHASIDTTADGIIAEMEK